MNRLTVVRLLFLVFTLTFSGELYAQQHSEFDRAFQSGVHLLERGQFAEALVVLEQARALHETPALLRNIALARRGVGQFVEAAATLDRYRQLVGDRVPPAIRAEIDRISNELNASIALASVQLEGTGATVTIDHRPILPEDLGRPISLNPGQHVFRASGDGLTPAEEVRMVTPGERLHVRLVPVAVVAPSAIVVDPSVDGATVSIDGASVPTGLTPRSLLPGRHRVEVTAANYLTWSTTVDLAPGQSQHVRPMLERESVGIVRRWWFWTGIGLVVSGVVAAVLVTTLSTTEGPVPNSFNTNFMAIQER